MTVNAPRRAWLVATATMALGASLLVAPAAIAADGAYPRTAEAAQAAIEASLAATGATSISAGFTDLDGVAWQGTTGVIDASGGSPGPDTRYGIGSASKMFATAAVVQLVDDGLVDLDEPVVTYLPQFSMQSPQYRQITVRMLLDHSAGFPGTSYANSFTSVPFTGYAQQVMDYLARSNLKTTPGAMSVYCNDCFTVAGELVAEVSGMSYADYVEQEILGPLGMSQSLFVTGAPPAPGTVARAVSDGVNRPLEITNAYAAGGLMSTSTDMLSFARMLMAGGMSGGEQVLTETSITEMGTSQLGTTLDPVPEATVDYGLGWDSVRDLSLRAVGVRAWVKGGDTDNYHAGLLVAPDSGLAVFVAGAGTYSSTAAEAVAEEILLNALAERGDIPAVPERIGNDQPPLAKPTEADIRAMVGTYLGTPMFGFRISRGDGDTLTTASLQSGRWLPGASTMSFRTDGSWWVDGGPPWSFTTVKGWSRTYLVLTQPAGYGNAFGQNILGQRVAPSGPTDRAWRQRLGEWLYVSDLPTSLTWLASKSTSVTRIPGLPGYVAFTGLSPVNASRSAIGSMFLQVPLMQGRDLNDAVPIRGAYLSMGDTVMVKRDRVAMLPPGRHTIRIGAQGYGEWREASRAGTVSVRGADAWYVYDADLAVLSYGYRRAVDVEVPAGGMLLVLGEPGAAINLTLTR